VYECKFTSFSSTTISLPNAATPTAVAAASSTPTSIAAILLEAVYRHHHLHHKIENMTIIFDFHICTDL